MFIHYSSIFGLYIKIEVIICEKRWGVNNYYMSRRSKNRAQKNTPKGVFYKIY